MQPNMDQGDRFWTAPDKDTDPELLLDVCELSVCLGNFTHNVNKSTKILEQHLAPSVGYSEMELINKLQERFEQLKRGADAKERVLIKARGNRFLQLYMELRDLEPDEYKRVQYLMLLYKLFDSECSKLKELKRSQGDLRPQAGFISGRLEAGFVMDNVCSGNSKRELTTTIFSLKADCYKECTSCPVSGLRFEKGIAIISEGIKIEGYIWIEGYKERISCCPIEVIYEKGIGIISERIKIEGYVWIKGYKVRIPCCPIGGLYEKGVAQMYILRKTKKFDLKNTKTFYIHKSEHFARSLKEAFPINNEISSDDFDDDFDNYKLPIQNLKCVSNKMRKCKSEGKHILKNDRPRSRSYRKPIFFRTPSLNSNNSFLEEEYESETESLDEEYESETRTRMTGNFKSLNRATNKYGHKNNIKMLYVNPGYAKNDSEIIKSPESQSLIAENDRSLNLSTESCEQSDKEMISPIIDGLQQTVSEMKLKVLKKINKSLLVFSQPVSQLSKENDAVVAVAPTNNYESGKLKRKRERSLDIDISEECSSVIDDLRRQVSQGKSYKNEERQRMSSPMSSPLRAAVSYVKDQSQNQVSREGVHWQHQRHIIIAPRFIINLFNSNPAYKCPPDEPNAPSFFEQVNQLFEVIGQRNSSLDVRSIQSRLVQFLQKIKKELPRDISYSDWVATVGKYRLDWILLPAEMRVYESLCWHLRDRGGQYPKSGLSRFRDALKGMLGQESEHLTASPVTGRLQIRSPHHQESVGESYLLLTLGNLGYLYCFVKVQLEGLDQQGETAAYLVRSLRKDLLIFQQFVERKECQPCSLLCLYWETRQYQFLLQWLLKVLARVKRGQAIVVSLYEESRRRTGEQGRFVQMWLAEASKPLVSRLVCWLSWGQLTSSDQYEFIIERSSTSGIETFWQQRYRLTASFSKFFDRQLSEMLLSVGKTVAYCKKYLGRDVEPPLSSRRLNSKLIYLLKHFYGHGEQEPLFDFLHKLHSDTSGKVLNILRSMSPSPKDLFNEVHKYLMITDVAFYQQLMDTLGALLDEPATKFNIRLFNLILGQMLPRQTSDMYVDKSASQGSKCWSCFLLRLKLPDHWRALLGEGVKEYEAIFSGLWKFHYANYVLSEMTARQDRYFESRSNSKCFDCIGQVDELIDRLIDAFKDAMQVLGKYFLKDLLEPAYITLRLGCEGASTLEDMLSAHGTYLCTIKRGVFQTKSLRKCNMHLGQLYDCIMDLDFQEQKFTRLLQNFMDFLTKYGGQRGRNEFLIPSYELTDRKREFSWSCQNSVDALITIKDQFNMIMLDLLFSMHSAEVESFRILALKLDQNGYYEKMDERLQLVQRFKFKRKGQRRTF